MVVPPKARVKRKTFAARGDLLDRLGKVASERGYSLYALINEVFEMFLRAEEVNVNFREVLEDYVAVKRAREAGFILELESLCYDMADLAYQGARDEAVKRWFEAGVWFAKRYAAGAVGDGFWEGFERYLKSLLWNVQEFEVEGDGSRVSLRVLSPRFSEAYTILFTAFLEGCLTALGYRSTFREVFRGRIFLEASRVK
ncbi:MAG: hypothetical protein QXX41_12570 [Nitrososphaerota archaeon]